MKQREEVLKKYNYNFKYSLKIVFDTYFMSVKLNDLTLKIRIFKNVKTHY